VSAFSLVSRGGLRNLRAQLRNLRKFPRRTNPAFANHCPNSFPQYMRGHLEFPVFQLLRPQVNYFRQLKQIWSVGCRRLKASAIGSGFLLGVYSEFHLLSRACSQKFLAHLAFSRWIIHGIGTACLVSFILGCGEFSLLTSKEKGRVILPERSGWLLPISKRRFPALHHCA
jgi:hypothetical protein